MPTSLESIKATHPLTYKHFSSLSGGEAWLNRVVELDSYWANIGNRAVPHVIENASALPKNISLSGTFDLIYAGATLGLLHAAAMTHRYGKSVLVIDRHTPASTHRDWNISMRELHRLRDLDLISEPELKSAVTKTYRTGFVEFAATQHKKRLFIDEVLDCAVESDVILQSALERIKQRSTNQVLAETRFEKCYLTADGIVVQVRTASDVLFFKAKVLVDAMGVLSPIAMQLNGGVPQTHLCPTVGTLASGLDNIDYDLGEILVSTEPADTAHGNPGRQLIWEGFPASDTAFTSYLFFYDRADSSNDKSLLNLFETYFEKLPSYKPLGADFKIHKPVFGIIPAYHHAGFGKARETASDRIILFGDAASLSSPLTFCGFGSMVRNLERTTAKLADALDKNTLSKPALSAISAFEPNVSIMSNLMKYMCYDAATDAPNFVNDLMNEVMKVLDELPVRYRQTMFRDEMSLADFTTLILTVGRKYPKIFEITYHKLGISGSLSWLQNWTGWAASELKKSVRI
ncbi:MAG: hypothetical protein IAF08_08400 [Rhizobacter sp.]|nr:hypothetical protein [Chlorobiales bacterium]